MKKFTLSGLTEQFVIHHHNPFDNVKQETAQQLEEPALEGESIEYIKQPVFLNTPLCKYSPYQMHCSRIYPGITLVVLTEVSNKHNKNCTNILEAVFEGDKYICQGCKYVKMFCNPYVG